MRYSKYPGNCRRDDPNRGCLGATSEAVPGSNAQSVHIGLTLTVHGRALFGGLRYAQQLMVNRRSAQFPDGLVTGLTSCRRELGNMIRLSLTGIMSTEGRF